MLMFGGESSSANLGDLHRYSLEDREWSASSALGPAARSRHSAIWAAATRSMLVFAGWSGQQYLDGLHSYDASANRWTELPAAGYWPPARGGHAAVWDPVSMSMLILGGIQNLSINLSNSFAYTLSYDSKLYNYSLSTGSWKEEGQRGQRAEEAEEAGLPAPTGRTGHAMVWADDSRGLLAFGGFDGSYLQETWRYVASETSSPLLLSCQVGRNCDFDFENTSGIAAKRACSDSELLDGLLQEAGSDRENALTFQAATSASRLFVEPGYHRLCWCDADCSHPSDFQMAIGHFIVQGPYLNQSGQCHLGSVCVVPEWRGIGISTNDSIIIKRRCLSGEASSGYSGPRSISISFNVVSGSYSLHVGLLDPAEGLKPEVLELLGGC